MTELVLRKKVGQDGVRGIRVHTGDNVSGDPRITGPGRKNESLWTTAFYKGLWPLPLFSAEALKASEPHFKKLRDS